MMRRDQVRRSSACEELDLVRPAGRTVTGRAESAHSISRLFTRNGTGTNLPMLRAGSRQDVLGWIGASAYSPELVQREVFKPRS